MSYLGWYDGKRNLLGSEGIGAALIGMEPPEFKGEAKKLNDSEYLYEGVDQNQISWVKRYRLVDNTVHVSIKITSRRDQPFEAIVYSLADLPDATVTGGPADQYIHSPIASAHFRAEIESKHFPGEQMTPFAMRSDSHHLEPGDSMEFRMTWELTLPVRR